MDTLILFIFDAVILMLLMRLFAGAGYGFFSSLIAAVLGAIGAAILSRVFIPIGPHAPLVATFVISVGFGLGISLVYNVGLLSSVVIAFIFLIVRSCAYYLLGNILTF